MSVDENLKNLNIKLPKANDPVGSYAATRISGNLLYISGQISIDENGNLIKGKLGKDYNTCLLYTSPSPRDVCSSRMPSSA